MMTYLPKNIAQMLDEAVALHRAGDLQEAEKCYRKILLAEPCHSQANHNLGALLVQTKQAMAALSCFMAALEADPAQRQYWLSYVDALFQAGQSDAARQVLALARQSGLQGDDVEALAQRLEGIAQPVSSPQDHSRHVQTRQVPAEKFAGKPVHHQGAPSQQEHDALAALFAQGRYEEAIKHAQAMTERFPALVFSWKVLGASLKQMGRNTDALTSMLKVVELSPNDAEAYNNLGITLQSLGRMEEAEASHRQATKLKPDYAEAHFNRGATLQYLSCMEEAEACYRRALHIKPGFAEAHGNLGVVLHDLGRLAEAEACYRQALRINPQYVEAHSNLGRTLHGLGRLEEAGACYRKALQIEPKIAEVHSNLGVIHERLGRLSEAETCHRRALALDPDLTDAHTNLGNTLKNMARLEEAETCYRQALQIKPNLADAHSNLLFCLSQNAKIDAPSLFSEHRRFGEKFEAPFLNAPPQFSNTRDAARPLRIGFVSGDLRNHAVASFIEPVLKHLSAYPQLSLYAYANHPIDDSTSQRLRGYFAHWHPIAGLSDAALADKIRADGIDILIDLSGHTAKNRLLVFARKPAPLQATWIGYPGTTGMSRMDYYLTDGHLLPPGEFDDQFTEKIIYLPAIAPFLPSKDAPPVNVLPALGNGHVTFGSFNRLSKLSREVIALWAQILRAQPTSRMLLGGMPEAGKYDLLIEWFALEGIARERLEFHPRSDMAHYLKLHQQVDICLDTFPYSGGTTTLHALWMGVPTLNLTGATTAGRTGASILSHAGLEAFIAHDAADFVQKGLYWAEHLTTLADIRRGLRERFELSAMGRPELIAAGLEQALRIMWKRWCEGLPPVSFEVSRQQMTETTGEAEK